VRTILVYATSDEAAAGTAAFLLEELHGRGGEGRLAIALSGGTTPMRVYSHLAATPGAGQLLNERAELFFSDERAVPPDHRDSNYGLARRMLFEPLGISEMRVHRMRGEAADPGGEAARYEAEIRQTIGTKAGGKPVFDLILLGMGEDGHTASLFPGDDVDGRTGEEIVARHVEKVGGMRYSFSLPLINRAQKVLFLVTGERKQEMVKKVLCPAGLEYIPPAARIAAAQTIWVLDREAAQRLDRRLVKVEQR
jgi:6-phosphogluconolactonase